MRRSHLSLVAGTCALVLLAGCSVGEERPGDPGSPTPSQSPTPTLPPAQAYELAESEPGREVKVTALEFLESALNFESAQAPRDRVGEDVATDQALEDLAPLLEAESGSASVVYPQLGGLTSSKAAIFAVVDVSTLGPEDGRRLTMDVRLEKEGDAWLVSSVESTGGEPEDYDRQALASDEELNQGVRDLLGSDAVTLSDTAIMDLVDGTVDSRVSDLVAASSEEYDLGLTVFSTGHTYNVFDTDRQSNHTRGRAVDIWEIDGEPVSYWRDQPLEGNPARELMTQALESGSDEVGGPWAFSTADGATFTNEVHEDHLHLGFED